MANFGVIYDTCVLVPAPLRDLLLRIAEAGLVRASMSDDILDELERVLVREFQMPSEKASRLRSAVERTFDDSMISRGYYDRIETVGLPDPDDEHVLAAARAAGAQGIVTFNLRDFPADISRRFEIEIIHPDDFLLDVIDLFPLSVSRIIEEQAAMLRNPPKSYDDVLDSLMRSIPETVARLREL